MNILHINTECGWRGGEVQMTYLMNGLRDRNHENVVSVQPNSVLVRKVINNNFRVCPVVMRGELDFKAIRGICRVITDERIDIVHAHTSHAHTIGAVAAKIKKIPFVVTRRVDFGVARNVFSNIKYNYLTNKIIAISNAIKNILINAGVPQDKINVVYSGIDIGKFDSISDTQYLCEEFSLSEDSPIVGTIAHLTDHKGHKYLLNAVPEVLKIFPNALFLIIGKGELEEALKKQVKELDITENVIFTGFRKDIGELLSIMDLFVLPSHLEGLCTSLMDAMLMKLPAVATTAGGIPEVVVDKETGVLVPPKNPKALADAIIQLLSNKEEAKEMGERGLERVKTMFNVSRMVEETEKVYMRLYEHITK
ncbi:glycosyltransferase family 4 protein [bacterium]|nr:glycosyltransferase family 4 protein [bacterium]